MDCLFKTWKKMYHSHLLVLRPSFLKHDKIVRTRGSEHLYHEDLTYNSKVKHEKIVKFLLLITGNIYSFQKSIPYGITVYCKYCKFFILAQTIIFVSKFVVNKNLRNTLSRFTK
jgi:hypothetical protein